MPRTWMTMRFWAGGLIELYEATFDAQISETALELNKDMIQHFWDQQEEGCSSPPMTQRDLIVRKKEVYDGAIPSGNAVAMLNLLRLGRFTGDAESGGPSLPLSEGFFRADPPVPVWVHPVSELFRSWDRTNL